VFDPETKTLVTTLPYSGLVIAGPLSAYAYYLTTSGSTATLHVIDMPTRTEIKSIAIPGVGGSVGSFIRWGNDGFAFRTTGGQVFLIRATIADDQDGDGIADAWEKLYFGSTNGAGGGAGEDPDGDGMNNLDEFHAGTNPRDGHSYLRLASVRTIGNQHGISFSTATGRRYRVERSLTLLPSSWVTVQDNIQGNGGVIEVTDGTIGNSAGYYRLVLLP
jgi:hypothetical protein